MIKKILLKAWLFSGAVLHAQQPKDSLNATVLQEIVISNYHINDSLITVPASIGILSGSDLQRNNFSDISPAINTIAGVYMQSGNINTNRISIRGIGARTPYGTNKIRAFYGSIPLTSGDSETTIEDIDVELIDQVEIIKGPLSSVYGAGLGGAIIITPKLHNTFGSRGSISTTHGSFGLMKNSINYSLNGNTAGLNLSYHKLETNGYRENSSYRREAVTLSGELLKKQNNKLTYFTNYTYLKAFIPSSISKQMFEESPQKAAPTWKAAKGYEEYNSYLAGLAYDWKLRNINNSTSVFINAKDNYEPRPFDILTQNTIAYGLRTQFSGVFNLLGAKPEFILGAEYFRDDFKSANFENLYLDNNDQGSLEGEKFAEARQKRNFINVFAQLRVKLYKKLEIQSGINVNKTKFNLTNILPIGENDKQSHEYNAVVSPQLSLLYKPSAQKTFYVSLSHGFSSPGIEETLTPQGIINPEIKQETGYNLEAGSKFYLLNKKLYTEIALYRMDIKNLLVAQRVGDDQYVGTNAGKTLHQGIEISLNYKTEIIKKWFIETYVNGSFGRYRFKEFIHDGNDFSGNRLTGTPSNKINAGFTLKSNFGLYASSDFYFVDKLPMDDANSVYADAYNLLNIKAGYRLELFPGLFSHINAGINNIYNTHYAAMVLVNAAAVGNNTPRYYYPGLPVNYYANISFSYLF